MLAKAMRFARSLLLDWQHFPLLLAFMLLAETLLGSIIILKVPCEYCLRMKVERRSSAH